MRLFTPSIVIVVGLTLSAADTANAQSRGPAGRAHTPLESDSCAGLWIDAATGIVPSGPRVPTTKPAPRADRRTAGTAPCTAAAFAALDPAVLPDAIASSSATCLGSLWAFDADVHAVITASSITDVAALISSESPTLSSNATRLQRLMLFYQIAFFHEFFESTVSYDAATFAAAQQALLDVAAAPDFMTSTTNILDLRQQWTTTIDSTNGTHLAIVTVQWILERYAGDPAHAGSHQERVTAYNCLFSIARQIGNANLSLGDQSPWYTLLDVDFADAVAALALDTAYSTDSEFVVLNAIFALAHFSYLQPATYALGHDRVSQAYAVHVQYSAAWLRAVLDLDNFYGGELFDGTVLDIDALRADVETIALPNTYVHDGGRLIFRTPLDAQSIRDLVDALHEVDSQFFRKGTYLDPVPGDVNDTITLVIYGSPADYAQYQPFLFGLPTNNGGIFIEADSHLYTYERTAAESIYTLEELLRHEYTHYLDSRYLVAGSFGQAGTLYDNNRMVWHNEGFAEFLVGATRVQDVLPRRILVDQIDGDATQMPIAEIVYATYGSFTFYRYAGTFYAFMNDTRPDLLVMLLDLIRANDIAGVDAFYAALAADAALQTAFDAYIAQRISEVQGGSGLYAEDVPTALTPTGLSDDNAVAVRDTLDANTGLTVPQFRVSSERFEYRGTLTRAAPDTASDVVRADFEAALDSDLATLTPLGFNFASATAWFGDVEIGSGSATATVVFTGPYSATANDTTAPAAPSRLTAVAGIGQVTLDWADSTAADLQGYLVYRATVAGGPYSAVTTLVEPCSHFDDTTIDPALDYYYVVTALDASGNESPASLEVVATSDINVLLINGYFDNGNHSYVNAYANELTAAGIQHREFNPFVDGPITSELLLDYAGGLVIWVVGYMDGASPTQFDAGRQSAIQGYLDAGGRLLISGAYKAVAYDNTVLFQDYFGIDFVQFNVDLPHLTGVTGHPLGDQLDLTMASNIYESEVNPLPPAVSAFTYDPLSGPGSIDASGTAVATVDNGYRVAYLAFPFADLQSGSRTALLERLLAWLLPAAPTCDTVAACADLDGNGVRDDNCTWSSCDDTACTPIAIPFADMGGAFGACPPDDFANIHDRNHALKCFAGNSTCDALNIDAGGAFGACAPDGFCNIHDANAALAAFAGTTTCTCPMGPAPDQPAAPIGRSRLMATATPRTVRAGERIAVRVFMAGAVDAVRSYQLATGVSGGTAGHLSLVEVAVEARHDDPLYDVATFEAHNLDNARMLRGVATLDDAGVSFAANGHRRTATRARCESTGDTAYLATFTYEVSTDATGTFVIEPLVHDGAQTFLIGPAQRPIALVGSMAAIVTIEPAATR